MAEPSSLTTRNTPGQSALGPGLAFALGAYLVWGIMPLYFRALHHVSPPEIVAFRTVCSLPVCLVMAAALGQLREVGAVLRRPRRIMPLVASAAFIATNWLVYVLAVAHGHVLAASLGYYINPLVNVLIGTLVLGERLSRRQWAAVGLAAIAVALLAWGALDMLWISMTLALSFAIYGLVRKLVPVSALPGLTIETMVLTPFALVYLGWTAGTPPGLAFGTDGWTTALLAAAGIITALPLFLFAEAARRLDLSTLGFVQYLTPTMLLFMGIYLFNEPLRPLQVACFALIWLAIGIYTYDLVARHRARPVTAPT